eukprot:SAG11_NODE_696_length_7693_cov_9.962339_4_plen_48_part_00
MGSADIAFQEEGVADEEGAAVSKRPSTAKARATKAKFKAAVRNDGDL